MRAALELHKEVIQGLQTVDAFSQDQFLPEEIDFHLNKEQDSYVNELLDKGFSDRQLRLDHIQDLIVKNKPLEVFISPTSFYYESGAVNAFLPGNYKHLLITRASVRGSENCTVIEDKKENVEETNFYYSILKLDTTKEEPNFYSKVELIKINEDLSETVIATVELPVPEKEDTYLIVRNIMFQASAFFKEVEIYWEKYTGPERQGNIEPNSFIIVDPAANKYKLKIDGDQEITIDPVAKPVETYTTDFLKTLTIEGFNATAILDNKEIYNRDQNIFFKPKRKEPYTAIADGVLFNYYGEDFIIDKLVIDYIREPQPISLALDQGCELSISASHTIADRVIEYLKLLIENPAYREVLQHNELRNQG